MSLDPSLLVRAANTTFNAAESSPMLQCNDIRHCRTLQSIIYGSFSTVFLCTWTALHFDAPYPPLLNRVGWMLGALFAPEIVFMHAFDDWTISSELLRKILMNYPECGWTQIHAQLVTMEGFRLVGSNGKMFLDCVKDGTINLPKVSKDEILGRSKGDLIAKIITVIQTAWFVFQCIHRRSQDLLLTELEITTLAHTLINFVIYFCWWHKPLGVAVPIEVPFTERRPETIGGRDGKVGSKGGSWDGNDNIQVPRTTTETGENPTKPPPVSNDDPSRASDKGLRAVATKSSDDKSIADPTKESQVDVEAAKVTPPLLSLYTRLGIKTLSVSDQEQFSLLRRIVLNTIYFIVSGAFGAMHCLAWNSAFPTRAEQYTWQVSSLIVTVVGSTMLVYLINRREVDHFLIKKGTAGNLIRIILIYIPFLIYCFARVSLLILALLQLRALPHAGYATPSWSTFYPHIG